MRFAKDSSACSRNCGDWPGDYRRTDQTSSSRKPDGGACSFEFEDTLPVAYKVRTMRKSPVLGGASPRSLGLSEARAMRSQAGHTQESSLIRDTIFSRNAE